MANNNLKSVPASGVDCLSSLSSAPFYNVKEILSGDIGHSKPRPFKRCTQKKENIEEIPLCALFLYSYIPTSTTFMVISFNSYRFCICTFIIIIIVMIIIIRPGIISINTYTTIKIGLLLFQSTP